MSAYIVYGIPASLGLVAGVVLMIFGANGGRERPMGWFAVGICAVLAGFIVAVFGLTQFRDAMTALATMGLAAFTAWMAFETRRNNRQQMDREDRDRREKWIDVVLNLRVGILDVDFDLERLRQNPSEDTLKEKLPTVMKTTELLRQRAKEVASVTRTLYPGLGETVANVYKSFGQIGRLLANWSTPWFFRTNGINSASSFLTEDEQEALIACRACLRKRIDEAMELAIQAKTDLLNTKPVTASPQRSPVGPGTPPASPEETGQAHSAGSRTAP